MKVSTIAPINLFKLDELVDDYKLYSIVLKKPTQDEIRQDVSDTMLASLGMYQLQVFNCDRYSIAKSIHSRLPKDEVDAYNILGIYNNKFLGLISSLIDCLWFIKDNSVMLPFIISEGQLSDKKIYTYSGRPPEYTNSVGKFELSEFSKQDLDFTVAFINVWNTISREHEEIQKAITKGRKGNKKKFHSAYQAENHKHHNWASRIQKAFEFITMARTHRYMPNKIAMYAVAIECLFSADSTELTHKISERFACYIGASDMETSDFYDLIKDAYVIRSKVFHGAAIPDDFLKENELEKISFRVDNLLRRCMLRIVGKDYRIFFQEDTQLNDSLNQMVFSKERTLKMSDKKIN